MTPNRKPFLYYKLPGSRRIVPQTSLGWVIFGVMMVIVLAPVIAQSLTGSRFPNFMIVQIIMVPVVLIAFTIIALRNADVVDLRSDATDLADFRQWQAERRKGSRGK